MVLVRFMSSSDLFQRANTLHGHLFGLQKFLAGHLRISRNVNVIWRFKWMRSGVLQEVDVLNVCVCVCPITVLRPLLELQRWSVSSTSAAGWRITSHVTSRLWNPSPGRQDWPTREREGTRKGDKGDWEKENRKHWQADGWIMCLWLKLPKERSLSG